jgi:hypothetical protein
MAMSSHSHSVETETRKLFENIKRGKINLAKKRCLIEDLEAQIIVSIQGVEASKLARLHRKISGATG